MDLGHVFHLLPPAQVWSVNQSLAGLVWVRRALLLQSPNTDGVAPFSVMEVLPNSYRNGGSPAESLVDGVMADDGPQGLAG